MFIFCPLQKKGKDTSVHVGPLCGMSLEGVAVLADREINGVTVDGTSEAHLVPFATSWPVQPNVTRPEK